MHELNFEPMTNSQKLFAQKIFSQKDDDKINDLILEDENTY